MQTLKKITPSSGENNSSVPGGCTYWPALRGMKATYLGYKSVVVSFPDHTPLSRNVDLSVSHLIVLQNCLAALFLLKK